MHAPRRALGLHLAERGDALLLRPRRWWMPWRLSAARRDYDRIQQARGELAKRGQMFAPFGRSVMTCTAGPYVTGRYTNPVLACTRCYAVWNVWITTADPMILVREVTTAGRHHQLLCHREDTPDGRPHTGTPQSPVEP